VSARAPAPLPRRAPPRLAPRRAPPGALGPRLAPPPRPSPLPLARPPPRPPSLFYASSACIYPEYKQLDTTVEGGGLKESDAWPAQPQDAYGLEKLATEELCMHYNKDFGLECRIGRFHNIYGPHGTWKGGREKAPAAFCRKVRAGLGACCGPPLRARVRGGNASTRIAAQHSD
jgi:nucleoside-diphosphate-sugar epimerase